METTSRAQERAEDVLRLLQGACGVQTLGPAGLSAELAGRRYPVLRPASGESLAEALAVLGEHALSVLVRGGGTKLPPGLAAAGAGVVLETGGLGGVHELDAEEGVVRVGAGLALCDLAAALEGTGWELPLDPPGPGGSVGGALAAAAVGPRFARPRDVVLGLDVVLASGERTRCGGRVVKNVTGYDLAKLHVGGFGALGVIEAAWLRLRPCPEQVEVGVLALPSGEVGFELALEASRRPTVRVAAQLDEGTASALGVPGAQAGPVAEAPGRLVVELAGDAPAVEADRAWLAGCAELQSADPDWIRRLRLAQGGALAGERAEAEAGLRLRVALAATRVGGAAQALVQMGARTLAYPDRGLLYAWLALPASGGEAAADARLEAARRALGSAAVVRVEAAPEGACPRRGAFDVAPALLPLHRALWTRFDPRGVLAAGRLFGAPA